MRRAALCLLALACDRAGASAPLTDARAKQAECADAVCAGAPSVTAPPAPSATQSAPSASEAVAAPAPPSSSAAPPARDPLLADDGTALPQTDQRPSADSPALLERTKLLVDAILHDEPARALPAFFPVVAYEQVKAI